MIIYFKCNNKKCNNSISKYFKNYKDIPNSLECVCGKGSLERQICSPTSHSTQVIDNGIQARQVEVSNSVVEKERERLGEED